MTNTDRNNRTLYRWTVADMDDLLGYEASEEQIEEAIRTLDHSTAGEVFHECIMNSNVHNMGDED